ncbi:MAG: lipase [Acidimicrobiales bacterium]|nr:lipase [Acidimicrobiales bacterium]
MTRASRLVVALAAVALSGTLVACEPDSQREEVDYTIAGMLIASNADPDGDPPGANDWTCKPSKAHPRPVVLVHGLMATKTTNWHALSPVLADAGYCVFALTYGQTPQSRPYFGGLTRMEQSAKELDAFVAKVRRATRARSVDLVGHSEGTVMPQYYLKFLGGAAEVRNFVALAPLYDGTTLGGVSTAVQLAKAYSPSPELAALGSTLVASGGCQSCEQFLQGSEFLEKINQGGPGVASVRYTNVMTRYDELVIPYTSGRMDSANATDIVLQDGCEVDLSDHLQVAYNPRVARIMLNALDPTHRRPVPCTPVAPVLGG